MWRLGPAAASAKARAPGGLPGTGADDPPGAASREGAPTGRAPASPAARNNRLRGPACRFPAPAKRASETPVASGADAGGRAAGGLGRSARLAPPDHSQGRAAWRSPLPPANPPPRATPRSGAATEASGGAGRGEATPARKAADAAGVCGGRGGDGRKGQRRAGPVWRCRSEGEQAGPRGGGQAGRTRPRGKATPASRGRRGGRACGGRGVAGRKGRPWRCRLGTQPVSDGGAVTGCEGPSRGAGALG